MISHVLVVSTPDFRSLVLKIQICMHARYLPFDPKSKDGEIAENSSPDLPHIVHKASSLL